MLESAKNSLSPSQVEEIVIEFMTNSIEMCRFNFTNNEWHYNNPKDTSIMLGFSSFDENKNYESAFFHDYEMNTPAIKLINNKMCIKPDKFITFEQIILVKIFMHRFLQRQKLSLITNISHQVINYHLKKWMP